MGCPWSKSARRLHCMAAGRTIAHLLRQPQRLPAPGRNEHARGFPPRPSRNTGEFRAVELFRVAHDPDATLGTAGAGSSRPLWRNVRTTIATAATEPVPRPALARKGRSLLAPRLACRAAPRNRQHPAAPSTTRHSPSLSRGGASSLANLQCEPRDPRQTLCRLAASRHSSLSRRRHVAEHASRPEAPLCARGLVWRAGRAPAKHQLGHKFGGCRAGGINGLGAGDPWVRAIAHPGAVSRQRLRLQAHRSLALAHRALAAKPKRGVISSLATNIGRLTHRSSLVDPEVSTAGCMGPSLRISASVGAQTRGCYSRQEPGSRVD